MEGTQEVARTEALGRAIRRYRGEVNQTDLALRMNVSQATVSNWELGIVELTCEQVTRLERRLGLTRGTLLVEGGYLDEALLGFDAAMCVALAKLDSAVGTLTHLGGGLRGRVDLLREVAEGRP
ncbi:MAG: helix-turn-helix transcriptional regulator [Acidimicrobiales bacterium]